MSFSRILNTSDNLWIKTVLQTRPKVTFPIANSKLNKLEMQKVTPLTKLLLLQSFSQRFSKISGKDNSQTERGNHSSRRSLNQLMITPRGMKNKREKVFKNGPGKICGRQPLKNLKGSGLL